MNDNFLQITEQIFGDLDVCLIIFLNELSKEDRIEIYSKVNHINDDSIEHYHSLVKIILEACEEGNLPKVKEGLLKFQEMLSNLSHWLIVATPVLKEDDAFLEAGIDINDLSRYFSAYLLN